MFFGGGKVLRLIFSRVLWLNRNGVIIIATFVKQGRMEGLTAGILVLDMVVPRDSTSFFFCLFTTSKSDGQYFSE